MNRGNNRRRLLHVYNYHTGIFIFTFCCFLQTIRGDAPLLENAVLPLEHRAVYGSPLPGPPAPQQQYGAPGPDDPWPLSTPDQPQIKHLQVQCEKTHMRVNIEFDRPFYGMIFSKGFYSDHHCVHLKPGTGHLTATFEIFLNSCGMSSSGNHVTAAGGYSSPSGSFVENIIIIQYDPYVQEVWDQARKLRCTWYDFYEKAVTFRPFQVDMLHAVTANFLGDNLQCWMQIQVGKGPWASEVSGIVKIGQTMTMVLAIKDDENKFDMLVRNCVAHDGKRAPIQLVDQNGCVVRHKIMSKFQKIKNFGPSASVVSFAYFQAFKFPDSMNVHFQCVIQVCRYNCPEPKCAGDYNVNQLDSLGDYNHLPAAPHGEYGLPPPPPHGEYGLPPPPQPGYQEYPGVAYPDPRNPSGPAGAYSEPKPDIVPAPSTNPNHTNPSSPPPQKTSPVNNNNNINAVEEDFNLPPPPLPGQSSSYTTVKRTGVINDEENNLMTLGGRPRSVEPEDLDRSRKRRSVGTFVVTHVYKRAAQEMTDVNTSRIIQVVAPGDVNFALNPSNNNNNNETVVISSPANYEKDSICISMASFVAGLVMLLAVLVVACLVAAFLFIRVRALDSKDMTPTAFVHTFDATEFVKVAT